MSPSPPAATVHVVVEDERVRESVALTLLRLGWTVRAFASRRAFLDAAGPVPDGLPVGCLVVDRTDPELRRGLRSRGIDLPLVPLDASGPGPDESADPDDRSASLDRRVREAVARHVRQRTARRGGRSDRGSPAPLTRRETEVLALLERGLSSKHVGRELGISHRTADVHRANVMRKLEVRSLAQLRRSRAVA